MARIADGDRIAFAEIYRRHSHRALKHAGPLCASHELAEEVVQDAFVSLWRSADRYQPALGGVGTWVSRIVRNRAVDAWRYAAARPVGVTAATLGPDQPSGCVSAWPNGEREWVLACIARLPRAQSEAVFLAYFVGLTHAEIASWAGAPLGTIKARIRLALDKLGPALDERPAITRRPAPAAPCTRPA